MTQPIRGTTRVVGVWGWPVKHSASPAMHNAAFAALGLDWVYVPFAVAPERVGTAVAAIRALDMAGVNITVPLKETVAPFLDTISDTARIVGSVNTIVNRDGLLFGDSTDGAGFLAALSETNLGEIGGKKAVVLGAGGSSRAVVYALLNAGAIVVLANRNAERAASLAADLRPFGEIETLSLDTESLRFALNSANLLVNTTSVGMFPNTDEMPPVAPDSLPSRLVVCDLIYNPWESQLLHVAQNRGCATQNGAEMLVRQGAIALQMWTEQEPPLDVMRQAVRDSVQEHNAPQ